MRRPGGRRAWSTTVTVGDCPPRWTSRWQMPFRSPSEKVILYPLWATGPLRPANRINRRQGVVVAVVGLVPVPVLAAVKYVLLWAPVAAGIQGQAEVD